MIDNALSIDSYYIDLFAGFNLNPTDSYTDFQGGSSESPIRLKPVCLISILTTSVAEMVEDTADTILACFFLPQSHRKRLRITNRRTRVVRIFLNDAADVRLITALAAEQIEEWLSGWKYLDISVKEGVIQPETKAETTLISI